MIKVLVIDDNSQMRRMVVRILVGAGHEVHEAEDGEEGLKMFLAHAPAIVVTDILMPKKEGIETIKELRRAQPAVRILAISGGGMQLSVNYLDAARKLGADDVLAKPFRAEELLRKIDELMLRGGPAAV